MARKRRYWIGGVEVSRERHLGLPEKAAVSAARGVYCLPRSYARPAPSDALGVHPGQVAEATAYARANGVPTEYLPDGRPLVVSCAHQKALAKLSGARPKRGY